MSDLPILIIGAGVAGPCLAISLKQKGYNVLLFEKYDGPAPGGVSLYLAPNGLRVLQDISLTENLLEDGIIMPIETVIHGDQNGPIVTSNNPTLALKYFGIPFAGVKRSVLLEYFLESAKEEGVDIRFNYSLIGIEQAEDSVTAIFQNGERIKGSMLVGCDGLHSNTRIALFGNETAAYTGLTQTGGMALVPQRIRNMLNFYGDNIHFIGYPVGRASLHDTTSKAEDNYTLLSWACTSPETESRESWKSEVGGELRARLLSQNRLDYQWSNDLSLKDIISKTPAIVKFGLYDRKELSTWHQRRVLLMGDAAHPTAPHLGQGANQALEDVGLLTDLLVRHIPPAEVSNVSLDVINSVFNQMDAIRIPRTSKLVSGAREMGKLRVLPRGSPETKERAQQLKENWELPDNVIVQKLVDFLGLNV